MLEKGLENKSMFNLLEKGLENFKRNDHLGNWTKSIFSFELVTFSEITKKRNRNYDFDNADYCKLKYRCVNLRFTPMRH